MWGHVNIAAILFLLATLTALVLAAVAQNVPKWLQGTYQLDVPWDTPKGSTVMNKWKQDLRMKFEQCEDARGKNENCEEKVNICEKMFCLFYKLAEHGNIGKTHQGGLLTGQWTRGLKESCEELEFQSASNKVCNKKKRFLGTNEAKTKMDSQMKAISDMVTAGIVLEAAAFVFRVVIMALYQKFSQYSAALRIYILFPVADSLLKILSCLMFADSAEEEERIQLGFWLYIVSTILAVFALVMALIDQCYGGLEERKPCMSTLQRQNSAPLVAYDDDVLRKFSLKTKPNEMISAETEDVEMMWGTHDGPRPSYGRQLGNSATNQLPPPPRYESPRGSFHSLPRSQKINRRNIIRNLTPSGSLNQLDEVGEPSNSSLPINLARIGRSEPRLSSNSDPTRHRNIHTQPKDRRKKLRNCTGQDRVRHEGGAPMAASLRDRGHIPQMDQVLEVSER